jgi:hypothetical protein
VQYKLLDIIFLVPHSTDNKNITLTETEGSHGGEDDDYGLLGFDTMYSCT